MRRAKKQESITLSLGKKAGTVTVCERPAVRFNRRRFQVAIMSMFPELKESMIQRANGMKTVCIKERISQKTRNHKRNQMEILELKSTIVKKFTTGAQ